MEDPIELRYFLDDPDSELAKRECDRAAKLFSSMGALTLRDPRVNFEDNKIYLDMVEKYFDQSTELKLKDARPLLDYQVGVTPEGIETPRCTMDPTCKERIDKMDPENKAHYPSGSDVKWRYFYSIGSRPISTKFPTLNNENILPEGFPDWKQKMDNWGNKLVASGRTLAEMSAVGFGLDRYAFVNLMNDAPHLLAPTASDLSKYGTVEQVLAGFHQDLNFVTIHGKSRFPGLYIWLRNGKKIPVSVPDGCLLAQAGMQFEYLTGGRVIPGFHEVVVNAKTLETIERAKKENQCLWRISSTVFVHIASDKILQPLLPCALDTEKIFPPILAGDQVANELKVIKLGE